ncbi:unnamed protein product [Acanthoscelides obtectus]|nr:unnamed protein product [Acanthoscelides obtectus]CAK1664435.1 Zinc finger protein 354C [Acanthoscelides obtectus]
MDQPISSADGDIQYVLNNSSQFILEPSDPEKLGNVFYTDGTQAIFVDGGLIADSTDGDGQTYVLQDCDLNQYYIPETGDIFLSEEDQSSSGFLETVPSQLETDESTSSNQLVQIIVEDQVVDLEDFIQQGDAAVVQIAGEENRLLEVLQLTLLITYQKKGPHVKVILDPHGTLLQCLKCNKSFKTKGLLYAHLASEHGVNVATKQCGNCSFTATSDSEWEEHRKYHEGQQVLGCVEEGCDAYFSTLINLSKHAEVHKKNNNNKKYSLSSKQLSSLYLAEDLNGTTKKSQESKQGKIFQCKSCKRIFSRYSNLMRHAEIHTGQDMYRCSICGSTYHYASSLTRHMVQNHIKA